MRDPWFASSRPIPCAAAAAGRQKGRWVRSAPCRPRGCGRRTGEDVPQQPKGAPCIQSPRVLGGLGAPGMTQEGPHCSRPGGVRGSAARTRKLSEAQTGDARCRRFHHPAKRRGLEVCSESDRTVHLPEQSRVGGNSSPLVVRRVQSVGAP